MSITSLPIPTQICFFQCIYLLNIINTAWQPNFWTQDMRRKEKKKQDLPLQALTKTRMGVCMSKVYCSSKVRQGCKVYLTWKVRGLCLVYFATDISSQEKWVVRKTRKWASWVGVTAETHTDTHALRAGEGHHVVKRATAKRQKRATFKGVYN